MNNNKLLVLLTAAFALNHLDRHILSITLNNIGIEFEFSDLQLGALSGLAFSLVHVFFGFPIAKLVRPGNRKFITTSALFIWSSFTALMVLATGFLSMFLVRMGVAIGEAGCVPAAHSMLADKYHGEKRTKAFAIFSSGANIGIFLAFILGGFVAQQYGWRMAFIIAGIPGILLAIIMIFFLKEPMPEDQKEHHDKDTIIDLLKSVIKIRSVKHTFLGVAITSSVSHGALAWAPTYLIRSHGLELSQVGAFLALTIGIFGAVGTIMGGRISEYLRQKHIFWGLGFVGLAYICTKPLSLTFYLADNTGIALAAAILPSAVGIIFLAPTVYHVFNFVKPANRPLITVFILFMTELVGHTIGPLVVGFISDFLAPSEGANSLRYALALIQIAGVWGGIHFLLAGKHAIQDYKSAKFS